MSSEARDISTCCEMRIVHPFAQSVSKRHNGETVRCPSNCHYTKQAGCNPIAALNLLVSGPRELTSCTGDDKTSFLYISQNPNISSGEAFAQILLSVGALLGLLQSFQMWILEYPLSWIILLTQPTNHFLVSVGFSHVLPDFQGIPDYLPRSGAISFPLYNPLG